MRRRRSIVVLLFCFLTFHLLPGQAPVMKAIPGGSVLMGCTAEQAENYTCNTFEKPVHKISVYPFQLGKFEVKQSEWDSIVPERSASDAYCIGPDRPACNVSFYEALTYCNRLSVTQNLQPCYYADSSFTVVFDSLAGSETMQFFITVYWDLSANGYRLPTESEWEYAARGGENQFVFAGSDIVGSVAWYSSNTVIPYGCRDVGTKGANQWGIHDMSGNVWEWIWDNSNFYPALPVVNFAGPLSTWQNQRSARGGSYVNFSEDIRVAARGAENPGLRQSVTGFRVAQGSLSVNCTDSLLVPSHASVGANPCGAIRWRASNFAVTGYKISIGTSQGGSDLLADKIVPDTFYYPDPPLPMGDTVFITIVPFTNSFVAEGCQSFWFVTGENTPQNPLTLAPLQQPFICEFTQDIELTGDFTNVDSVRWSTGETSTLISVSETGTYQVQVYFEGCMQHLSTEIKQGQRPVPDPNQTLIYPTLAGQASGAIDITVKDGVPPYQFSWEQAYPPFAVISHEEDVDSLKAGKYDVYITDYVGCGKNWFYSFTVDSVLVGTAEVSAKPFMVYPVPASDKLYFDAGLTGREYMVFNCIGQRRLSGTIEQNFIHVTDLSEGFYLLLISNAMGQWSPKTFVVGR